MIRRPVSKRYAHKDRRVDTEFSTVYGELSKVVLGPFRFFYSDEEDALYLQVKPRDLNRFVSVMKIDRDGVFSTTGAHNASATLEDLGV